MLTFKTTGEIDCASNSIKKIDLLSQKKKKRSTSKYLK